MIKERYVSLEVAKLLRDKGFLQGIDLRMTHHLSFYDNLGLQYDIDKWYDNLISDKIPFVVAPTQAMACDWVEETFNISIVLDLTILGYEPCFLNGHKNPNTASTAFLAEKDYMPMPDGDNSDGSWSSKELAYNEALKYALTNMI